MQRQQQLRWFYFPSLRFACMSFLEANITLQENFGKWSQLRKNIIAMHRYTICSIWWEISKTKVNVLDFVSFHIKFWGTMGKKLPSHDFFISTTKQGMECSNLISCYFKYRRTAYTLSAGGGYGCYFKLWPSETTINIRFQPEIFIKREHNTLCQTQNYKHFAIRLIHNIFVFKTP